MLKTYNHVKWKNYKIYYNGKIDSWGNNRENDLPQIGLGKKDEYVPKNYLKEFWIQFSWRLKNYMPKICQKF